MDRVSWHPFFGQSPECEAEHYYDYPSIVAEIKDAAMAHGFEGDYQADSMSWWAPGYGPPGRTSRSSTAAAKYYARGIVMNVGMNAIAGYLGIDSPDPEEQWREKRVIRNLCSVMAGHEAAALPVQIQATVTNTVANVVTYTFSLPDDSRLAALWTDGIAADYDAGITTTVTLAGFGDHAVTGIDVLHGLEQELVATEEKGDLVIHDLLVKDYPIILRVSPTRRVFLPSVLRAHPP